MALARTEMKELFREFGKRGWSVESTGSNHLKWVAPDGHSMYFSASTPGDVRAIKNIRSSLKRLERGINES